MDKLNLNTPIQQIKDNLLETRQLSLYIKRDDLIHPDISGNKWRKLKYNIAAAKKEGNNTLLTFGGAFSNHIVATAALGNLLNLKTIGVIRGEEFSTLNHSLQFAASQGMQLHFISRSAYKKKNEVDFLKILASDFGDFFMIPEGGSNRYGIQGCREILQESSVSYDFICAAAGTGTTAAGILAALKEEEQLLVFPAIKGGETLAKEIQNWQTDSKKANALKIISDYHFGGFAKVKQPVVRFANQFYKTHGIPLDLIYTAKMMYGLYDLIENGYFPKGSSILFYHSGGLQGNRGFSNQLKQPLLY